MGPISKGQRILGVLGDVVVKLMNPGLEAPHAGKDAGVTVSGPIRSVACSSPVISVAKPAG